MVAGYIIIGTIVGLGSSGISLMLGASLWAAFMTHIVVGNIAILLTAIVLTFNKALPKTRRTAPDRDYEGRKTRKPARAHSSLMQQSWHADAFSSERSQSAYVGSNLSGK